MSLFTTNDDLRILQDQREYGRLPNNLWRWGERDAELTEGGVWDAERAEGGVRDEGRVEEQWWQRDKERTRTDGGNRSEGHGAARGLKQRSVRPRVVLEGQRGVGVGRTSRS